MDPQQAALALQLCVATLLSLLPAFTVCLTIAQAAEAEEAHASKRRRLSSTALVAAAAAATGQNAAAAAVIAAIAAQQRVNDNRWWVKGRSADFYDNQVLRTMSNADFRAHYRVSK